MKVSLDWLQDFVAFANPNSHEVARCLTESVAEVEVIEDRGAHLHDCCVGKVLHTSKHPNADKLFLVDTQTDRGTKRVVCGGTNLKTGMLVAFAHVGAKVRWHGGEEVELTKASIRGEESEGMICTAEELELTSLFPESKDRILIDLGGMEGCRVGAPLQEALGLKDTIFHINNHAITHRPDLFSQVGFARECVALGLATWRKDRPKFEAPVFPKAPLPFTIKVEREELMPRYCACVIAINSLGKTPPSMVRRLEGIGFRSVNLPVDITNYVACEIGVPLHSFDLDDISGKVTMRRARQRETITTLDHQTHMLPDGALILEDTKGIFDLLGIMGGLRSSTKESTKRIYLHSASLDPVSIRRTVIATGHRTEAATVYEKGIPHITAEEGFYRACELFLQLTPGAKITSRMESKGNNGHPKAIPLGKERIQKFLGIDLPEQNVRTILTNLGFTVRRGTKGHEFSVLPPLFRLRDIHREEDLIEEIGRITGFDGIKPQMPSARIDPPKSRKTLRTLRTALKEEEYIELLPLSLVGPKLLEDTELRTEDCLELASPLSEEISLLAPSPLPRLLEHAEQNLEYVEDTLRTFTIANTFEKNRNERLELALLTARRRDEGLSRDPFLEMKRSIHDTLSVLGFAVSFVLTRSAPSYAHPGRVADVTANNVRIGSLLELHPRVCERFDLQKRAVAALLDLTVLLSLTPKERTATLLPRFPAITYDLTIQMTQTRSLATLLKELRGSSKLLTSITVHDVFESPTLPKGSYNLTLRCTYRSSERTLTELEAKAEHEKVLRYTA